MTDSDNIRILLVDDSTHVEKEVERGLRKIGVTPTIRFAHAADPDEKFAGCKLPAGQEWDSIDLALVDLELVTKVNSVTYRPEDLRGGTEVLPHLRIEAPWIPAVAYSLLYTKASQDFLPVGSGFGFDGHTWRGMFTNYGFSRELWDLIVGRAQAVRSASIHGWGWQPSWGRDVELRIADVPGAEVSKGIPGWKAAVQRLFGYSKVVSLEAIPAGWSGARVLRGWVQEEGDGGPIDGEWLVKVSTSPWKLQREIDAHMKVQRSGNVFARSVPLLWQTVVVAEGAGAIAYQFARGTVPGGSLLASAPDRTRLASECVSVVNEFYEHRGHTPSPLGVLLRRWCAKGDALVLASGVIGDCPVSRRLRAIHEGSGELGLGAVDSYQTGLVHGDLHLGNLMVGKRSVFIDFAHSAVGPVAIDAAKLFADLLVRSPELRDPTIRKVGREDCALTREFGALWSAWRLSAPDVDLFDAALRVFLAIALTYDSTDAPARDWIVSAIKADA